MDFTPMTSVHLLQGVPLSIDNNHQILFPTKAEQTAYFLSKVFRSASDFTYQRENKAIAFPGNRDVLYAVNYLMYRNDNFSDKWFYAYVTKLEYRNDNLTIIYFQLDPFQTWQHDLTFQTSFVEREHCDRWNVDGSPVINTVPESLDLGPAYDVVETSVKVPANDDYYLMASTVSFKKMLEGYPNMELPKDMPMPRPQIVNGLQTGLEYYVIKGTIFEGTEASGIPFSYATPEADDPYSSNGVMYGDLMLPVKTPYHISSPYGMRADPFTGVQTMHDGIDFTGLSTDPIYAVDGGVVTISSYHDIRGNYMVIKHSDVLYTLYQHLSSRLYPAGAAVSQGAIIARMGTTGSSTGVHLHFGMSTGQLTGWMDPADQLPL